MEDEEDEDLGSFNSKEDECEDMKEGSFQSVASETKSESDELSNDEMKSEETSRLKPSSVSDPNDFVTQPSVNPKPDLREFPRQTNKDTLSILKAKRIIRHNKPSDGPDLKKYKSDQVP